MEALVEQVDNLEQRLSMTTETAQEARDSCIAHDEQIKGIKEDLGDIKGHLDKQDATLSKIQWYVLTSIIGIMGTIIAFRIVG